jgi:hypothetical protein
MKTALSALVLSTLALTARLEIAGVAATVDSGLISNVKYSFLPSVITTLNNYQIGKIEFDGGYVDNLAINLQINDYSKVQTDLSELENGVIFGISDVQGQIKGSFKYKVLFVSASGDFKVTFQEGGCKLHFDLPIHTQNVNGRNLPQVKITDFLIQFDSSKIKIDLSGSILADIVDQFIWIFKSSVIKTIQSSINKDLPD